MQKQASFQIGELEKQASFEEAIFQKKKKEVYIYVYLCVYIYEYEISIYEYTNILIYIYIYIGGFEESAQCGSMG
jgi:hypothetical protein